MELKSILTAHLMILVLAGGFSLHAADNAAQAAARLALEQKMQELDATAVQPTAATQPKIEAQPVAPAAISPTSAVQVMNVPPTTLAPIVIAPAAVAPVAPAPVVVAPVTIAPIIIAPTVVTQAVAPVVAAPTVAVAVVPVAVTPPPVKTSPAKLPATLKASAPVKATTIVKPSGDIVTLFGAVYHHAQVDKVDTDGVVISYWTEAGGYSIIKLDFNQFSPEFVDQYRQ